MTIESTVRKQQPEGLTKEAFARLLEWLDQDRENAGKKYETIRLRLIKIFTWRGCSVPEELADATVDRVAGKLKELAHTYVGEPALYFFNVADKIYLEYGRKSPLHLPLPDDLPGVTKPEAHVEAEDCFERCMQCLPEKSRELILAYYEYERTGRDKLDQRKALAQRMAIPENALWIRAHRIRQALKKCVEDCTHSRHR